MNAKTMEFSCTANDIFELNQTKEYLLASSCLLEKILTDSSLNASATKLWQLLFNKAKFHPNLETKISVRNIATLLNKSIRTIFRYLNQLIEKGYLIIANNYRANGGQSINTFQIRAPKNTIEEVKRTKDRNPSNSVSNLQTNNGSLVNPLKEVLINDKIDREGYDNNDIQDNIININNTNNNVVVKNTNSENLQKQLQAKEQAAQELTLLCEKFEKKWLTAHTQQEKIFYNSKFRTISTELDLTYTQIHELKQHMEQSFEQQKRENNLQNNPHYINHLSGERQITHSHYQRLKNTLQSFDLKKNNTIQLLNEIIFEVRFGSLATNNQTKQANPVERAINIALKLVREGRWTTPSYITHQ